MKTIRINLYEFQELSEKTKIKVIENNYNINVNYEWWQDTYEDAKNIDLKITGFNDHECNGGFIYSALKTANEIIKSHGENCETYKTAKEFLSDYTRLIEINSDGINKERVSGNNKIEFDEDADILEDEFLKNLLEDYRVMLINQYEYLTSEEEIITTLISNEYHFTEDGKMY